MTIRSYPEATCGPIADVRMSVSDLCDLLLSANLVERTDYSTRAVPW
jgi:hypothetical protein